MYMITDAKLLITVTTPRAVGPSTVADYAKYHHVHVVPVQYTVTVTTVIQLYSYSCVLYNCIMVYAGLYNCMLHH